MPAAGAAASDVRAERRGNEGDTGEHAAGRVLRAALPFGRAREFVWRQADAALNGSTAQRLSKLTRRHRTGCFAALFLIRRYWIGQ
jgi:methylase of polypeptide subunit release factors